MSNERKGSEPSEIPVRTPQEIIIDIKRNSFEGFLPSWDIIRNEEKLTIPNTIDFLSDLKQSLGNDKAHLILWPGVNFRSEQDILLGDLVVVSPGGNPPSNIVLALYANIQGHNRVKFFYKEPSLEDIQRVQDRSQFQVLLFYPPPEERKR